jgi:hypothetical protein
MSSKSIYPHVPYFYVIEHIASGKKYAGSRWIKGCHPAEFMQPNGYCTSSPNVKRLIEEYGIEAFQIVEIKTIDDVGDVLSYETKFLVENDCAKSEKWLNAHNNTGISFGTKEFKSAMLAKHGIEHSMQSEEVREKSRQTMLKNHGVECSFQSEKVKEKSRQTCLKNRGVEYPMQSEDVKEKSRQTCLDRYGHEYSMQSAEVQEKSKQTMLKNHGVEYTMHSEEVKEKSRQTCLKNYGVEYSMQSEEVREKSRQTMLKNHGVDNYSKTDEFKEKLKQTCLKNHGVENYGQTKEHKERTSKLNFERLNFKVDEEIRNGNFSRFVYLYDIVEHVFLMGVERSLNRGLETSRYIKIVAHKGSFKKYVDVLTGKTYQINTSKFSIPLPSNFILR